MVKLLNDLKYELRRLAFGAPVDKAAMVRLIERIDEQKGTVAPEVEQFKQIGCAHRPTDGLSGPVLWWEPPASLPEGTPIYVRLPQ